MLAVLSAEASNTVLSVCVTVWHDVGATPQCLWSLLISARSMLQF